VWLSFCASADKLALTQLLLRALAVGDVDHGTHEFDEINLSGLKQDEQ